jgi:hypothetical protein
MDYIIFPLPNGTMFRYKRPQSIVEGRTNPYEIETFARHSLTGPTFSPSKTSASCGKCELSFKQSKWAKIKNYLHVEETQKDDEMIRVKGCKHVFGFNCLIRHVTIMSGDFHKGPFCRVELYQWP